MLLSILFVQCNKKNDDPAPVAVNSNPNPLPVKSDNKISKKWLTSASSEYASIEFTPYNKYIIQLKDSTFITGNYSYDSVANHITLVNEGDIKINNLTAENLSFDITLDGTTRVGITSKAAAVTGVSDMTLQMARTWKLVKQTINGTDSGFGMFGGEGLVIITKFGTHFIQFNYFGTSDTFAQVWKWSDQTEKTICVGDVVPNCSENPITVNINGNKMTADYTDTENGVTEKFHEEYEAIQ